MRFKVSFIAMAVLALASVSFAQQGGGGGGGRQGGGFGQFGRGGAGAQRLVQLIRSPQVQTELKVTEDQKTKIEALPRIGRGGPGGGPGGGGPGGGNGGGGGGQRPAAPTAEEQLKQLAEDKAVTSAILTPEQEKRLEELRIQWAGAGAVNLPDVQASLELTADQKAKIADLNTKMREATTNLMEKMRNGEVDRTELPALMTKNTEIMKTEVDKILTDAQKTKLKALGGTELKREMPQRPGGN